MAKAKLSERQDMMIHFIESFTNEKGYPPTIREIGVAVRISSTSVVNYNLNRLEQGGYILRDLKVSRGVRLADSVGRQNRRRNTSVNVPIAGYIFASAPVLVGDTAQTAADETVALTRDMVGDDGDLFALRVKGDSMIDAMVNDGDIVVLKKIDRPHNGDMVAIWLTDRGETTLKHFFLENGRVRLQPANPTMGPIFVDPNVVEVQGKVMLVLRQMQ